MAFHYKDPNDIKNTNNEDSYKVYIPTGIEDKDRLFEVYYQEFDFPEYFGFNWDALLDCLRELPWIDKKNIVIVHMDIPFSDSPNARRSYLKVLNHIVDRWKKNDCGEFEVVFPQKHKDKISRLF